MYRLVYSKGPEFVRESIQNSPWSLGSIFRRPAQSEIPMIPPAILRLLSPLSGLLAVLVLVMNPLTLRAELDKDDVEKAPDIKTSEDPDADPHEKLHEKIRSDGETNLKEVLRLMDEIQDDLAGKKTGAQTQAKQRKTIKKIEELIDKLGKG